MGGARPRVFVETNFLLEYAYRQDEAEDCEELLQLGSTGVIELLIPAFSLFESRTTIRRNRRVWERHRERIQRLAVKDFGRVSTLKNDLEDIDRRRGTAVDSHFSVADGRLAEIIQRIEGIGGGVLAMTSETLSLASKYRKLTPPDAIVFASIVERLQRESSASTLFVSRDTTAFSKPDIKAELRLLSCDYLSAFSHALGRIRHV